MEIKQTFIQTIYIPCGDMCEDYLNLVIKAKIQMIITGGEIREDLLEDDVCMRDMLRALAVDFGDTLVEVQDGDLDTHEMAIVIDLYVHLTSDEAITRFRGVNTDKVTILPLVLEYYDTHGEYITDDTINFVDTIERFEIEVSQWMSILDIHDVDTLSQIQDMLHDEIICVKIIGEVAYVVLDTDMIFENQDLEEVFDSLYYE
ncbi:MAG: hypothetical protein ACRC0G_07815 [Fusobacteriaceae bacterium]